MAILHERKSDGVDLRSVWIGKSRPPSGNDRNTTRRTIIRALFIILISIITIAQGAWSAPPNRTATFVKNTTCATCHTQQYQEWLGSHHERAMQPANEQTVLGDFKDASFTDFGVTSKFFRKADRFFVNTEGADGKYADFEVKYTFGVDPLQQYLLQLPKGRLQAFTVAWDAMNRRWFNLYPDEKIAPGTPLHWTGRLFTWNSSCAECHSTDLRLNYDLETDSYKTEWAEINVSCQSCHGPGSEHVKWAKQGKNENITSAIEKWLVVDYKTLDAKGQVETCARCHSRRYPISPDDTHGQPFLDHFMPELLQDGLYHPDGQILDEVYVYGSFIQSKMYHRGVSCMDCHNPHTLKLQRTGNALCTTCHEAEPPKHLFETLPAKNYDTPAHHFHQTGSAGASCVNCHLPAKTYMVVDPRRDHSFSSPRPDLSAKLGTPNACNGCHTDKSVEWAVEAITKWYGSAWQKTPHFAETIAAGRAGKARADADLIALANNTDRPAIVRATALHLLRQYGENGTSAMLDALSDESPLVQATAVQGLENLPNPKKRKSVIPLLNHPIQAVRIEAARTLASVPQAEFDESQYRAFTVALEEYRAAQLARADHPEGHFNLGRLYTAMGNLELAEASYKTAIERDAHFFPAHNNLANLYYQMGRKAEAEQIFRQALKFTTDQGVLYYSLGLILAEKKDAPSLQEAATHLEKAAALMPSHPRAVYNYGLLLQRLGRIPQAETALLKAHQLSPNDADILIALVTNYMQQRQYKQASIYTEQLTQLYPDVQEFHQLLESLRRRGR